MTETTMAFTRSDVVGYVGDAFDRLGIVHRDEVLKILAENGAPLELVALVQERVPVGTRFPDMRELWQYLRDLPVE